MPPVKETRRRACRRCPTASSAPSTRRCAACPTRAARGAPPTSALPPLPQLSDAAAAPRLSGDAGLRRHASRAGRAHRLRSAARRAARTGLRDARPMSIRRSRRPAPAFRSTTISRRVNVLVALLENERGELRSHSVQVARVCRRLCERLGLKQEESDAIILAAHLHDVGKTTRVPPDRAQRGGVRGASPASAQELPDAGAHLRVGALAGRGQRRS